MMTCAVPLGKARAGGEERGACRSSQKDWTKRDKAGPGEKWWKDIVQSRRARHPVGASQAEWKRSVERPKGWSRRSLSCVVWVLYRGHMLLRWECPTRGQRTGVVRYPFGLL
jgi:hypothetical protein